MDAGLTAIWAYPHHLHHTALPEWASTVGMLFSVMLWAPSWGGAAERSADAAGAEVKVVEDPISVLLSSWL
ncbi:MAG: cbb3-type cytochrome c oxidase subunit I [Gemmatimonadales bacterium]